MKIGIVGYGNLGRAVEAEAYRLGYEVYGIFSRRAGGELGEASANVYPFSEIYSHKGAVDVLINAGASKSDLGTTTPALAQYFDVVDSYDLHGELVRHIRSCDDAARIGGGVAIVGCGWDPGLFSILRIYMAAILGGEPITFWGRGVSQGHSQAIRTLEGVKMAIEYTVPRADALRRAERGEVVGDEYERTKRVCYVVAEKPYREQIERQIKAMPGYFLGYETEVEFISESEFVKKHNQLYHRGRVLSSVKNIGATLDFSASFDSNPRFTASVLLAVARAIPHLKSRGFVGAYAMADIPPSALMCNEFMRYL